MNQLYCGCFLVAVWAAGCPLTALAQAVVIANRAGTAVRFTVPLNGSGAASREFRLPSGELLPLRVVNPTTMALLSGDASHEYALEPCSIYVLLQDGPRSAIELKRIGFDVTRPRIDAPRHGPEGDKRPDSTIGEPNAPHAGLQPAPLLLPVEILVDDEEPAVRSLWEARLCGRVAEVSKVLERHCWIKLDVKEVATWESDDAVTEFAQSFAEFERKVQPPAGCLAIGFTSQYEALDGRARLGGTRGPLGSHILIREWSGRLSGPERMEVLLHELGHHLGAAHSPEAGSVMRPILGDHQALDRRFRIGFDSLNTLAMCLVSRELAELPGTSFRDMAPRSRDCLSEIYDTLAQAMPDDPAATRYLGYLGVPARVVHEQPAGATPLADAARSVLTDLLAAADPEQGPLPGPDEEADPTQREGSDLDGDELTERCVRAAAAAATKLPEGYRSRGFLLALAAGLDDSRLLRDHKLTRGLWRSIESAAAPGSVAALHGATLRGRHDLAQHYVVSAALTAMAGPELAESAGVLKELRDSDGGSGFSFTDYCADLSGIALARLVQADESRLEAISHSFTIAEYLPELSGLRDGLSQEEFTRDFGSVSDRRFRRVRAEIDRRIRALPGYRHEKANVAPRGAD